MKQYFLKASGIVALSFMPHLSGFAQDTPPPPPPTVAPPVPKENPDEIENHQEIIIKKKNDKDSKITIEIKNGKAFVNGKPIEEFNDDNVTIIQKIIHGPEDEAMTLYGPPSPFRGGWSYHGDDNLMRMHHLNTAFLGVSSQNTDGKGAKIKDVTQGSGAEKAGLKSGDVITKINETKISNPGELTESVHKFKPEDKITVTYNRDGKEQKTTATLGKNKTLDLEKTYNFTMPDMGKLKELEELNRLGDPHGFMWNENEGKPKLGIKAQDTEDGKGVKVLDVDDESPADKAGIKEGDIITQFDGKPVNSAETLANLARDNKDKTSYKINLSRDGKAQEVEVKIPKKLKTADL